MHRMVIGGLFTLDAIVVELPRPCDIYFEGSQVIISKEYCISFSED